jgi:hypothetical protein
MGRVKNMLDDLQPDTKIGYVYCLSNPAMPGLVKIGYTNRSTPIRAIELSFGTSDTNATGVPMPFEVVKDWRVPAFRAHEIEQQIHRLLDGKRVPGHGKWRPKEFFFFEPDDAVTAIENALRKLDWWGVAQAETSQMQAEEKARQDRKDQEETRKRYLANLESQIQREIAEKKQQWRAVAAQEKEGAGQIAGLKWGAIWFFGTFFLFGSMGAKDTIGWLCLGIAAFAFYCSKDGPANEYFASQEAANVLEKIENDVRKRKTI